MAYDPGQFFEAGQKVGKSKQSSLSRTSDYMSDLFKERDKEQSKINPLELIIAKQAIQPATGVYSWNPLSGQLEQQASVPKGSIVRNTTTEDDLKTKAMIGQQANITGNVMEQGGKLGTAVKRLNLVNQQLNEALPAKNTNPFIQRMTGPAAVIGAKTGIAPNPKLLALKKNIRPIGIQLIRAFGEVGNLSATEQQSAIDTVQNEGLNEEERLAGIKQFAEFALAGARPEALDYMMQDPATASLVKELGINLPMQDQQTGGPQKSFSKYKDGDTRVIGGVLHTRKGNKWMRKA